MASRTVTTLIDDLSGKDVSGDGRRVAFSLDGIDYQIDLSEKNQMRLQKALGPFISAATRVGGPRRTRRTSIRNSVPASHPSTVREWARQNGYAVADRGRVPADVVTAYNAAH